MVTIQSLVAPSQKIAYGVGDSNMAGYGLSDPAAEGYFNVICARTGATNYNNGQSGTSLQTGTDKPYNLPGILPWNNFSFAIFALVTNDALQDSPSVTAAGYDLALDNALADLFAAKLYVPARTVLLTGFYMRGFVNHELVSQAPITDRNAIVAAKAQKYGTLFYDAYALTSAWPDREARLPDGVHLDAIGHERVATSLLAADLSLGAVVAPPQPAAGFYINRHWA